MEPESVEDVLRVAFNSYYIPRAILDILQLDSIEKVDIQAHPEYGFVSHIVGKIMTANPSFTTLIIANNLHMDTSTIPPTEITDSVILFKKLLLNRKEIKREKERTTLNTFVADIPDTTT